MTHELKIWPQYYCRVAEGSKTFEVRENDRGFQPGDIVHLREFNEKLYHAQHFCDDDYNGYTNSPILKFRIGYVLPIDDKRVVFSLLPMETI